MSNICFNHTKSCKKTFIKTTKNLVNCLSHKVKIPHTLTIAGFETKKKKAQLLSTIIYGIKNIVRGYF